MDVHKSSNLPAPSSPGAVEIPESKPPDVVVPDGTVPVAARVVIVPVRERYVQKIRAQMADGSLDRRDAIREMRETTTNAQFWSVGDAVDLHLDDVKHESEFAAAIAAYLIAARRAIEESGVAACDVCGIRPGTHTLMAAGTETWACDRCSGSEAA